MRNKHFSLFCILCLLVVLFVPNFFGQVGSLGASQPNLEVQATEPQLLQAFSDEYLTGSIQDTDSGVNLLIESNFETDIPVQYAWYFYRTDDLSIPVYKTGYLNENSFSVELPANDDGYRAFVYVRDTGKKERVKAEVKNWGNTDVEGNEATCSEQAITSFSAEYLSGYTQETENGVLLRIRSSFEPEIPVQYAWYFYRSDDLSSPVYKTGYLNENSFSVELPANDDGYRAFVYVRDTGKKERVKAEVKNWETVISDSIVQPVSAFTRLNVSIEQIAERTYRLTSDFNGGPQVQLSWAVYRVSDKDKKIDGKKYSNENVFEYTLPEEDERYAIKVFVRNFETQEQKAVWVAYLPLEQFPEQSMDPLPEFTYECIERTILDEGYSFTNTFSGENTAGYGFDVYVREGAELILQDTVPGNTLRFVQQDPDSDYVLKAYVQTESNERKTVEFYRLYGITSQKCFARGAFGGKTTISELMAETYNGESVTPPANWLLPGINNRQTRNYWNTFRAEYTLIEEYIKTGKQEYAYQFIKYMQDWLNQYPNVPVEEDTELWTDFSISFRVRTFSIARILFDHIISNELLTQIQDHLSQCANMLASEFYYKEKHNHGMYQDTGLLLYLDAFGYTDSLETYREELAKERLDTYFAFAIADSGCHKEHSPSYHSDIRESVKWLSDYYAQFDDPRKAKYLDIITKMDKFYLDVVMPDFTWPMLGDSTEVVLSQKDMNSIPQYKWIMSKGIEGEPPEDCFAVYEDGGYVIMRSSWQDAPEEGTYAILTAATHSTAHKHQDDLNFLLYHKGQLFTEAGKRNYNYDEPETIYAYSSFAHNVLFVNRQGWPMSETNHPVLDDAAYETQITGYSNENGVMWASARSIRWSQVTQDRTLSYDRDLNTVSVCDVLTATEETDTRLIYHIAEGVNVEQANNGWILSRDGVPVANVQVEASGNAVLSTLRGQDVDGNFRTWLFDSKHIEEPMYGSLLIVDMMCEKGKNQVSLQIELK